MGGEKNGHTVAGLGSASCSFEQSVSPGSLRQVVLTRPGTWAETISGALLGSGQGGNKGLHTTVTLKSGSNITVYLGDTSALRRALAGGLGVEGPPKSYLSPCWLYSGPQLQVQAPGAY